MGSRTGSAYAARSRSVTCTAPVSSTSPPPYASRLGGSVPVVARPVLA